MAFELLFGRLGPLLHAFGDGSGKAPQVLAVNSERTSLRSDQHDSTLPVPRAPARAVTTGAHARSGAPARHGGRAAWRSQAGSSLCAGSRVYWERPEYFSMEAW